MSYSQELKDRYNSYDSGAIVSPVGKTLRLELTNVCNHKCICCPNRIMKRKKIYMDEQLAFRILREGKEAGCKEVGLFMNGEPFVVPDFDKYVSYAKKIGYEWVFFTTNGALAMPEKIEKVISAGCNSIKFSINAGTRETYKIMHGSDDFDRVIENLKYTNQYRKENNYTVRLLASCVVTKYNQDEVQQCYNLVKPYVDDIVFYKAESFAGQVENIEEIRATREVDGLPEYAIPNKLPCPEIFKTICVTAEGYLTLCCTEAFNNLALLDVNNRGLIDAWNSVEMQKIRKMHLDGNVSNTLCYRCIYGNGTYEPLNRTLYEASCRGE